MEAWEAPPGGSEQMDRAAEFVRSLTPGEYRLVCEAWEGDTLLASSSLAVRYLAPIAPMEAAW
jgi:hypothetical protein